ncbi:uncharacterized protein FIBRA_08117 [Fibroporia radiculosa]|uniref:Uncharacterized protein n=1 Tax=Fibroporia radiculosa TaxID=599839 RepID=J4GW90_9APHY|nr:uncharacterized protein FIBRA_08117 [Fibroporia radiculosa]CCM05880.1 predicted protein [Fibroporia radiculosa]
MPLNLPGILVPFHLLLNPRLVVPHLVVKDIRQLDFRELRRAGYRGAVFDKDNCLTLPHEDALVPELTDAWKECCQTFGSGYVLVVSNSAGSHLDAGEIQAEAVSHRLAVPVLRHTSFKPSYSCIASIRAYFASLPSPVRDEELIIVGDRLLTDVVLANRMACKKRIQAKPRQLSGEQSVTITEKQSYVLHATTRNSSGPLAIWTNGVWKRDSPVVRILEKQILRGVDSWILRGRGVLAEADARNFVRNLPQADVPKQEGLWKKLWHRFKGS